MHMLLAKGLPTFANAYSLYLESNLVPLAIFKKERSRVKKLSSCTGSAGRDWTSTVSSAPAPALVNGAVDGTVEAVLREVATSGLSKDEQNGLAHR